MRILHCSWEYPPIVYGGLGRHVHALAEHQAHLGHDVVVLTQGSSDLPGEERVRGVRIVRVPQDAPLVELNEANLMAWVFGFNSALTRAGIALQRDWRPDIVHGHDWLVAQAATALKDLFATAYVTTMHATEAGRHQGWLPTPLSKAIHSVEWWSTYQARRVIACSEHMRWEVQRLFDTPRTKTIVIPNGVDPARLRVRATASRQIQDMFGDVDIVFSGRLEWEKGVHVLVEAMRLIRKRAPQTTLVIAGRGSTEDALRRDVRRYRLSKNVRFAGWLPEPQLHALVRRARVAAVPSIYEPFGIVALEAAALGTPLVVAKSGGLAEFVTSEVSGRVVEPGDADALAEALLAALRDVRSSRRMARKAKERVVADYGWSAIAAQTAAAYEHAIRDERKLLAPVGSQTMPATEGNLLRLTHGT